jgi:hypothetical protein
MRSTSARNSSDQDRSAPDKARLLGPDREHEIRVRLGQVEQLLHAVAEAHAQPLAAAEGDQGLDQLEAPSR